MTKRGWNFISYGWIGFGLIALALAVFSSPPPGKPLFAQLGFLAEGNGASGASLVEVATQCVTEQVAIDRMLSLDPDGKYERVDARAFITALNAMPPPSSIPAPETLLAFSAPGRVHIIKGFTGGCQVFSYAIPSAALFEAVMKAVARGAI